MALIARRPLASTIDRLFWSDMHDWDGAVLKHFRDLTAAGIILSVAAMRLLPLWPFSSGVHAIDCGGCSLLGDRCVLRRDRSLSPCAVS